MPEHKAFERYFRKFDIASCHTVFGSLYRWFFNNLKFDNITLDIDSSVITRYGEQQGSARGYNRHKPGRKSQHPILAFLEETIHFLQNKKIALLRLDSGFYSHEIFNYLGKRELPIDYIVAVPMYVSIQRKIASQKTWLKIEIRIAMVLTTLRIMDIGNINSTIVYSDADFEIAMEILKVLLQHATFVFRQLPKATTTPTAQNTNPKMALFQALPAQFDKAKFIEIATQLQIPESTANKQIAKFCNAGLLVRHAHGSYTKKTE